MKILIMAIIGWFIAVLCYAQQPQLTGKFHIEGKIQNIKATTAVLTYFSDNKKNIDSATINSGSFNFSGELKEPVLAKITLNEQSLNGKEQFEFGIKNALLLYLSPGHTGIIAEDSLKAGHAYGTPFIADYTALQTAEISYRHNNQDRLNAEIRKHRSEPEVVIKLRASIDSANNTMKEKVYLPYISSHLSSPVALLALNRYIGPFIDLHTVEPVFNRLDSSLRKLPAGMVIADRLRKVKEIVVGAPAPDFSQADTAGTLISLSSFKGEYVLLDFWASWCGPCRIENPNVVKTYHRYSQKSFTVISVSLEQPTGRNAWLQAIRKDRLTWTNVSDLQYFNNQAAKLYGIEFIPQNFLIGPDGKILAKNLHGEELEKKLAELLD